jgi:hypothetical protein
LIRAASLLLLVLLAACSARTYEITHTGDAGPPKTQRGDGDIGVDGGGPDFRGDGPPVNPDAPDGCAPRPEQCNGLDDNCNGLIDEDFNLNTDPQNCGTCGKACSFANATAVCSIGKCKLEACKPGFVNLDKLEPDGCECQITNGGKEICDSQDNDCNGVRDDGFDLMNSVKDCGVCGRVCEFPHAAATCRMGECKMGACDTGFLDIDGNPLTGCEYPCVPSNGGVEICDGKDNNCDGTVDESDSRVGQRCYPPNTGGCDLQSGTCMGGCAFGTYACLPGGLVCNKAVLPGLEICDGQDNNCDGVADEGFDLQNDARWCGSCSRACDVPNAVPGCSGGQCTVKFCKPGFVDLDGQVGNGCEYACTPSGPEVCDGKDNDCDGKVDTDDPDLLFPMANFCNQTGECGKGPGGSSRYSQATFPVCMQANGAMRPDWVCNYPATVQLFAPNQVLGEETWCDGLDNDCDGLVDEHAKLGQACQDNGVGVCKRTGVFKCQSDKTLSPLCDVTGVPIPPVTDEVCDGKDNDCDGLVDESWDNPGGLGLATCGGSACKGVRDDLVHVTAGGKDYYIYQYEASRVDATVTDQGTSDKRSCSRKPTAAGLRPWTQVTLAQARSACAAAGMRLCRVTRAADCSSAAITDDEWGLACNAGLTCGGTARPYPYGCSYDQSICNGTDQARNDAVPTGSQLQCVSPDLGGGQIAYDMSGNVAEWTDDCRGTLSDGTGRKEYTLRGGSFTSVATALTCGFSSLVVAETFSFSDTGFRCCSSCAPGQADCGSCVSLASDNGNCGACGHACDSGQTCQNGFCR